MRRTVVVTLSVASGLSLLLACLVLMALDSPESLKIFGSEVVAVGLALTIALLVSWNGRKIILSPLRDLTDVARRVCESKDFSYRVPDARQHDAGVIVQAFNEMLDYIEERDRELREARDRAESATQAKSEFLANMSHEIRTPMTAILGYADLLVTGEIEEEERAKVGDTIRKNGEHLLAVINDILDLSKIEAGKMRVERQPFLLAEVVTEVMDLLRIRAKDRGIELSDELASDVPAWVTTDRVRLRQILINLVGNAVKFTEVGGVQLRVEIDPAQTELVLTVEDTGCGISSEAQAVLFNSFTQVEDSKTRPLAGTGLGLAISRRLARMLGGDITVESEVGRGSRFRATVALDPGDLESLEQGSPSESGSNEESASSTLRGRVLLVEDGRDNQLLVSKILQREGLEVEVLGNGQAGVDRILEGGEPWPDLVLMDVNMPVLDGLSATRLLREAGVDVPIIALTALSMEGDRMRCLEAGCNDYVTKPFRFDVLRAKCARWLRYQESRRPTGP